MEKGNNGGKPFNLEKRTLLFTKSVVDLCKKLRHNIVNQRYISQLLDAAGSVGANYREANEKLSKKDFIFRMRITRKECKESSYWLEILKHANNNYEDEIDKLIAEAQELRNIFTSIIEKST
ncbi:MAG: four helix bundle protein [Candidatus Omnitrophica bacterium]|nr:four helix bundle protein [Candidatus Omnitrophota bacterium]MCF7894265.1 four helix bundle protein [Candidatus Omnitrophota bacterium]